MIDTLKKLVSFKTVSVNDQPEEFEKLYQYIDEKLSSLNLVTKEYKKDSYISKFWGTVENPDLLFTAHVDVVPADEKMFIPKEEEGKLFGRGVLDMKFAIASFIEVFQTIPNIKDYSVGMLLTPDEEAGGFYGTKFVLEDSSLSPKIVLLPDGGADMSIEYAEKGIVHARITANGKSAHGSRPWLGKNAIDILIDAYQRIKDEMRNPIDDQWVSTVNAGKIQGGTATNVVPDQAFLDLDFRVINESDRQKIKELLHQISKDSPINAEILIEGGSFELDKNNNYLIEYLDLSEKISGKRPLLIPSAGSSDARFFADKNIPVIISRPNGAGHHSENEWIEIESLQKYTEILIEFAKKFKI